MTSGQRRNQWFFLRIAGETLASKEGQLKANVQSRASQVLPPSHPQAVVKTKVLRLHSHSLAALLLHRLQRSLSLAQALIGRT